MEIEVGTVYEHAEHDQIVVVGIHRVFRTYDTDTDEGTVDSMVVRWAAEWDAYGALWGHSRSDKLDAFLTDIGDPSTTSTSYPRNSRSQVTILHITPKKSVGWLH